MDLVILDVNLPDISGREILSQIRSDPDLCWLPVMHVSATFTGSESHALGLDLGADAYLTHPLDPAVFLATVRSLLRLGQAEAKVRRAAKEWRAAFDSLSDNIFVIGPSVPAGSMLVQRCNRAAAELIKGKSHPGAELSWSEVLRTLEVPAGSLLARASSHISERFSPEDLELAGRWYHVSVEANTAEPELGEFAVCVLRDITDRKNVEREVEAFAKRADEARHEAELANRAKGDFLSIMSHELRTPLNAIGGYVDLISMGIRGPVSVDQAGDLARIKRSQESLLTLINDLLNFAKVESGELRYEIRSFPITDVLDRASEMVEHHVSQRGLNLRRAYANDEAIAKGDADKVQQILLNLLANAIKFTPPSGTITISSGGTSERISIDVSDTGSGIPDNMVEAVFEPFVQVQTSRAREHPGVGLGLAISRDLARGMGGELAVIESSCAGTTFRLTLPGG